MVSTVQVMTLGEVLVALKKEMGSKLNGNSLLRVPKRAAR